MQVHEAEKTVATLANASALAVAVVQEVAGGEVAATLRGSELSQSTLYALVQAKIQSKLFPSIGG